MTNYDICLICSDWNIFSVQDESTRVINGSKQRNKFVIYLTFVRINYRWNARVFNEYTVLSFKAHSICRPKLVQAHWKMCN